MGRPSQPLTGPVIERVSPLDQHHLTAAGRLGDTPVPGRVAWDLAGNARGL